MSVGSSLTRRSALLGAGWMGAGVAGAGWALTSSEAWAEGSPRRLSFEVWRKGARIGAHTVELQDTAGGRVARISASMVVRIGPIPVFHYRHDATETWRGGRFESLEARTTSNGKLQTVSARRAGQGVRIERGGGAAVVASADAVPLTHWRRESLQQPLFNPQTGMLVRESVARRDGDSVALADGRSVPATRFALTGDAEITDWYDASGAWTALRGKVQDGSHVDYRRIA